MGYKVRIVLEEHPILQNGEMALLGENTKTIEMDYPDLDTAIAAISPKYINEPSEFEYRDALFQAVVSGGRIVSLHCYVPMMDETVYRDAVVSGQIDPTLLEIVIKAFGSDR